MCKYFLPVLFLLFIRTAIAQRSHAAESRQLLQIEQALMDAIAPGDIKTWDKYLDIDFYQVSEDGNGMNKRELLASMNGLPAGSTGHIRIMHPVFTFHKTIAVVHYVADEYETVLGQHLHTTYATTDTWYQSGGRWKMIGSQVFEIPQLPPAIRLSDTVMKQYTGVYQMDENHEAVVTFKNDSLFIKKSNRAAAALLPETENIFFLQSDARGRK